MQHLLAAAGIDGFDHEVVSVDARGAEVAAAYRSLRSPETYTGYERTEGFTSPGGTVNVGVARRFHELFPTSELFLLPGAYHYLQIDEPEQVAHLLLSTPQAA